MFYSTKIVFTSFLILLLASCGGGGGGGANSSQTSLGGSVATGAPIAGATVVVKDSLGAIVGTTTADSTGAYSISYDPTKFTPPFVIQADGQSGDAAISLVGVATGSGNANITQLSNAIAASLSSSGNPLDLSANPANQIGLTSAAINSADSAYKTALSTVMNVLGVNGSLLSGTFNAAFDKLLDNTTTVVQPSGQIIIGTTSGKVADDLAAGSSASSAFTTVKLSKGELPSSSAASTLVAPSSSNSVLSIADLENLRANLEACFALATADRGTPQSPASACADSKFVLTSDYTQTDGFKHSSYAWNNSAYDASLNHTSSYYAGIFGYMLTQSKYDNLKFLKPRIIRPLSSDGTKWAVKFPIQFSDGTIDQLGDAVRSPFLVVKKISSLISATDNGIRFIGDQRDFQSFTLPIIQKIVNQVTGDYRYESGLNLQVIDAPSSTDSAHRKPVMAVITGKGLPAGGVYLAHKLNGACGSYLPITGKGSITNIGTPATLYTNITCAGFFVFSISYSNSYITTTTNNPRYLKSLGNDGRVISVGVNDSGTLTGLTTSVGNYLTDSDIESIGEGEPYTFVITLSDGSTLTYVNRIPTRPITMADAAIFPYFPTFAASTQSDVLTFNGSSSASINFGTSAGNVHPWSAAIYWGTGGNSGTNSVSIPYTSSSATVPCTGSAASSCGTSTNWINGASTYGLYQVRSRTAEGVDVYSQIRNGF